MRPRRCGGSRRSRDGRAGPPYAAPGSAGPAPAGPRTGTQGLTSAPFEPTGLSPVRTAASQYGITSCRAGYRVATIAFGVAGIALAAGIGQVIGGWGRQVVILLVIFAIAGAVISGLPAVRARFGAIERGFYLWAIAWFAVFAAACATGTR